MTASNFSWKIIYTSKFAALVGYYYCERQFLTILDPDLMPRLPQKGSKFVICPLNEWKYQISDETSFVCANLQLQGGLPLKKWAIFDAFWPLECPKKSQKLWFVLNEGQIWDQKLYLCANFQLLGVIFRGMCNFLSFSFPLTPKVPQNRSKYVIWQKKWHNQNFHAKLSMNVKF